MKQRTLGILGGALLVVGVVLAIGNGIAANRFAPANGPAVHGPGDGGFPRQRGQGQPGPIFGDPRRRGLPGAGPQAPNANNPTTPG